MEKVERTQYPAALALDEGSNRSKLYEELGVGAGTFFRFTRLKTPSYLGDKLPSNCRLLYRCNNSNIFHEIR